MPQLSNRTQLTLHNSVLDPLKPYVPERKSLTQFVEDLLERQLVNLDTGATLEKQPERAAYISTSLEVDKEKDVDFSLVAEQASVPAEAIRAAEFAAKIKEQAKDYSPSFEAFWKVYQSCPDTLRVRSQSKRKAFEFWGAALKATHAEELQRAVEIAVQGQLDLQRAGEWAAPLPDAYRWLKEGRYEVLLEDHQPAQAESKGDWL
jgi:hypothetical protein